LKSTTPLKELSGECIAEFEEKTHKLEKQNNEMRLVIDELRN
jgi:hypothetical protein